MDAEEIEVAEVLDEEMEDEEYIDRPRRRITAGPIIAIVVVLIVVGAVLIYTFSEPEVEDITILEPAFMTEGDEERYGLSIEIRVVGGVKTVEGAGSFDVIFKGRTEYSEQVSISNDKGLVEIEFKDFIVENGKYKMMFSMDGKSEEIEYIATMVPYDLNLTYESSTFQLVARPLFNYPEGNAESISFYSPFYDYKVSVEDPDGKVVDEQKTMEEWNGLNRTISIIKYDLELEMMGYHTLYAEFTNQLVKESSPYRKLVNNSFETTHFINRPPVMSVEDVPSRISRRQEAVFSFSAVDPDTNGRILYFNIDWGDDTSDEIMIGDGDDPDIDIGHTWEAAGPFTISVSCADNGPEDEENIEDDYQRFDTVEIDIEVRLL